MTDHPRVVILGAGFGGLWAARSLAHTRADVVLVDRNNYHTFLPLLYQVAAAELSPEDIVYPVRSILRKLPNVQFLLSDIRRIDFTSRTVETNGRAIVYDYLILALGSVSHFFGVPGAAEYAFQLKTLEQGIVLRNQILRCFERALHEEDRDRRNRLLTFTIVGGGPTGVEFAGALAELVRGPLMKDFQQLEFSEVRVVLLDAEKALLSGFPEKISAYAQNRLRRMGVELRLETKVSEITGQSVNTKEGTVLPTDTVIWTAGVRGDPMAELWGLPTTTGGTIQVLPTLQLADHPEVYVIGDLAHVENNGRQLPMIAPVAIQQGTTAARNILRLMKGENPLSFHYSDLGAMVTIGRNAAVASIGGFAVSGFAAWIVWLTVHLAKLIGFRNRLQVLINWAWDYLFYERAIRLILPLGREGGSGIKQENARKS
jgi:NADH:ubiquinone reductase (H+-translocating)